MHDLLQQKQLIQQLSAFANTLADSSRKIILDSLRSPLGFVSKADQSPVTEIDQRVEAELRRLINQQFPEHGILGEEYASQHLDADFVWVIDPIDGTKAFITGMPVYGTLIALAYQGQPFIGIIDHPFTNERWFAVDGQQTTYNGMAVQTRQCTDLSNAIVSIGNPESLSERERAAFLQLRATTQWGIYGGNCYAYGRLASGTIDISLDSGLDPFDYCALDPIIRNAGGAISDWQGNRLTIHSKHLCVACGDPVLHQKVIEILAQA